ncbi:MAG: hypothetical protein QF741_03590 [Candidatus Peribacteraceae bacterium]|jgi:major membrane immunogen (membrane-anchored lipoprotein)|nr:hypothetical protein [Candidatus Peribacteraceae bacterium]MDP7454323.1 hypothetical protein [Candidatus Peribacteraceae bacterium]MDP7645721.1 hypothetical protein [Candidatus Peribacteraceae bacterium]
MRKILILIIPLLLISCGKSDKVKLSEQSIGEEAFRYLMPGKDGIVHPKHGKEVWFAYGAMSGTENTPANGVVQGYVYEDGTNIITMHLNVLPAREGSFYEAWFIGQGDTEPLPAGHLKNHFGDARHQLQYKTEDDIRKFEKVHVTLELDDGNPRMSEGLVAEGQLRHVNR